MEHHDIIVLLYIFFIWLVIIHTFEEISQDIFSLKIKRIDVTRNKYLIGASIISTINLSTLILIILHSSIGLYLAVFTTSFFGILQAVVHTIGFIKEGGKAKNFGAGFYSSIPLSIIATILLYHILLEI